MAMSLFRRANPMPTTVESSSDVDEKRIILIGCTGHGKGTFANFLYNLGQPTGDGRHPSLFEVSSQLKPDTQEPYSQVFDIQNSPNASAARKAKRFCVLDTPGLNDIGRDKDLKHMVNMLGMIGAQFRDVHSLILVYRFKTRIDSAIGPALLYYRDLFAPLFRAQSVILVLTHVSSDDYENGLFDKTWDELVNSHREQCNDLLQLNAPEWNCPIVRCFFVNSKWTPPRIDKFLEQINSKKPAINDSDLLYRSYLMREQILDYISEVASITLDTHSVSLPPALNTERNSVLTVINGRITELIKAVRIESDLRANQLTEVERLRTERALIKAKIKQREAAITNLCALQKTPSVYVRGDDWIKFLSAGEHSVSAPCDKNSTCGGCRCRYMFEAHNASHPPDYPKTDGLIWRVLINPDWLNFTKKEDRYWFYRFWLEYEGLTHNREQLMSERVALEDLKKEKHRNALELRRTEEQLDHCEAKVVEHNVNLRKLNDDKDILLPEQFLLSDIQGVLDCMEKNLEIEQ